MSHLLRSRFRTFCLAVTLLCGLPSSARACCFLQLLDPFHWLHGCSGGYGPGTCGGPGYGAGHGAWGNPHATQRFIDDWLGYGYLRNQEGTLGHYPGRPFGCYQPQFPNVMNPCAPPSPAFAMPGPMVAPMPLPMMQAPMPTMHEPCFDPCQVPCEDPCMPMPMVQQPMPMMQWGRAPRVTRAQQRRAMRRQPMAMMAPQPQYMMSAPMMSPMMDSGCDGGCGGSVGGDMMMPGMESMSPGTVMPEAAMSGSMDSGCCGDSGFGQDAMMMSPEYGGYLPSYDAMPYTAMSQWYMNPGAGLSTMPSLTRRQERMIERFDRRFMRTMRPAQRGYQMPMQPYSDGMGWTPQMTPPMTWQSGYNTMPYAPVQTAQPWPQMQGYNSAAYAPAYGWNTAMVQQPMMQQWQTAQMPMNPYVAGDITGDHEFAPTASAAIPVTPNAYRGGLTIAPAVWTNPMSANAVRRYDNVVR